MMMLVCVCCCIHLLFFVFPRGIDIAIKHLNSPSFFQSFLPIFGKTPENCLQVVSPLMAMLSCACPAISKHTHYMFSIYALPLPPVAFLFASPVLKCLMVVVKLGNFEFMQRSRSC